MEYWNKPCAMPGLISYRAIGNYGYIMIGAKDDEQAMREALRSTNVVKDLQCWNGVEYTSIIKKE